MKNIRFSLWVAVVVANAASTAGCGARTTTDTRCPDHRERGASAGHEHSPGGERGDARAHPAGPRASESFRAEHAQILVRVDETEAHAVALTSSAVSDIEERVHAVVHFFRDELMPHARAEEHVLYAVADRIVGAPPPYRWTDSLRHEHTVVHAAIEEMTAIARGADRSPETLATLSRLALRTLGLLRGHFGAEEEVVLDAIDRAMTAEDFEREVIAPTRAFVAERGGAGHAH
jgi:hypothetical protein